MKFFSLITCLLSGVFNLVQAVPDTILSTDNGYEIKLQLKPFKNQTVYLGHYYGAAPVVIDSAMLDEQCDAVFKKSIKLPEGLYVIFYPDQTGFLDLLVNENQQFSIEADLSEQNSMTLHFTHSSENDLFNQYQHFISEQSRQLEKAQQELSSSPPEVASKIWTQKLNEYDENIHRFRDEFIRSHPKSLLSIFFIAMREPKIPESMIGSANSNDSAKVKNFIKSHFWDGVNFWDGRLTYTPFFEIKLDKFFDEVLEKQTDSVILAIDYMMGFAGTNDIMNQFMLTKLLTACSEHRFKWDDPVFIHLFEKYIASKNYSWLSAAEMKKITEKAYFMMGKLVGSPATNMELPDVEGKKLSLDSLRATYTLVCFWDPTCEHCKETLPKLDSIYQAKWKAAGIKIYAVATETAGSKADWLSLIDGFHLQEWGNVYNSIAEEKELALVGKESYIRSYDVWYFPSFFLLDKDKRFIAKKLQYKPMFELIESLLKNK